ncbi:uncharacterized protein [Diabrotica undecimpunctata]|uniref:uncharacterized protein n=1 Tax=Diabrotica undecimpunctata TaxID=50387 RepID=UPI003B638AAD
MGDQADFATKFHKLDGDLKGERTKNLFKLLKTTVFENEEQLDGALKSLKPKSYQENLFYIETLIYFKRSNELLEVLKGGNDVYVSKILKQAWFFQNIFDNVEPEAFVTEFLPHVSYAVKKKFLNRVLIHWNEQKIDSLFEALLKKYGLPLAVSVLHKCSPTKIQTAIVEHDLKLNSNQVLNIYNKSEELFVFYLNLKQKYYSGKVLKNIAVKNPKLILKLQREQKIELYPVGKRTSKNIFNVANDDIIKDTDYYLRFLKNSIVIRKLGKNFETLFKNLFPNQLSGVNVYCKSCRLLNYYPKHRRWNLFNQTLIEKFNGQELKDLLLNFSSIMKLNPPKEVVELWAEVHYKEQKRNYNDYLKYYPPSKAIPMLKGKINVTSDLYERQSLVLLLIETCSHSEDLDALVEVLKYICFRHRNEEPNFRTAVLGSLRNAFKLENFNENHWKYIDEQFQILRIQKKFSLYDNGDFIEKYLEYLVKNGKDYKSLLIQYLKDMVVEHRSRDFCNIDLSVSKRLYTEMVEHIEDVINSINDDSYSTRFKRDFLLTILKFCQNNPEFFIKIVEFPLFVQLIQDNFSKNCKFDNEIIANVILYNLKFPQYAVEYNRDIFDILRKTIAENNYLGPFDSVFSKIILSKDRDDFANKMLEFYFEELFKNYPVSHIVCWFLRNEPKVLSSYMTIVAEKYATCLDGNTIYRIIKHYSHLGFDKIVSDSLIAQLDKNNVAVPRLLIIPVCILLSTNDFVTFVSERYLPKKDKLDLMDEEMREIYMVQCEVAKLLAHVNEPYKMLPTIMKFCRGDYLQSALPSLQKAFYRSPERVLYSYVEALSKQAVSARKHAIFLSCEVLDKQHTLNLLTNTKESNKSSLKYLFSATLKYFLKNPSEELLNKVIENMNSIDVNDKETLDSLKYVTIPVKYRAQYIENCWKYFEGLKSKEIKIKEYLNAFLKSMFEDNILTILSAPFISDIINRYFPVIEERLDYIDYFVVCVLQTRIPERNENFQIVFKILSKFSVSMRISFFKRFIYKDPDQQLLALFAENWCQHFTLIGSFDEHVSLKLNSFKLENVSVDDLATKTVDYLEQLITEFGYHCFERFGEQFNNAFNNYDTVEKYKFYLAILKYKITPTTCTLLLNNIANMSNDDNVNLRNIFNEIMNVIKSVETPIVRINLEAFLLKNNVDTF